MNGAIPNPRCRNHKWPTVWAILIAFLTPPLSSASSVIDDALASMPENSWKRININEFQDVWTPPELRNNSASPHSNISAWSGAAWDSKRRRLLIWGGNIGHEQGNEFYIFDTETGLWERGALPSAVEVTPLEGYSPGILTSVGGIHDAPMSGESWDNVVYLENMDRVAVLAVSREVKTFLDPATDGGTTGPYFWDPSRADPWLVSGADYTGVDPNFLGGNMWENRDNWSQGPNGSGLNAATGYYNDNGTDVVYWAAGRTLWRYTIDPSDPAGDTYEQLGRRPVAGNGAKGGGTYIEKHNIFVRPSNKGSLEGILQFYDLNLPENPNNRALNVLIDPSLDVTMPKADFLGVAYDEVLDQLVLWDGSSDIWTVDIEDLISLDDTSADESGIVGLHGYFTPTRLKPSGAEIPFRYSPGRDYRGVYGKWHYLKDERAFIGVIEPYAGDVFLYKPFDSSPIFTVLENGQSLTNLSRSVGGEDYFSIDVPSGASDLVVTVSGGIGDLDLYLRQGSLPTLSDFDCGPNLAGNNETCGVPNPAGTYYILLHAAQAYSGVTLTVSYTEPEQPPPNEPPVADFTYSPLTGIDTGTLVQFSGAPSFDYDGDALSYAWDFGDGSIATGSEVSHTFVAAGDYTVQLSVSDGYGGTDTISQVISVAEAVPPPNDGIDLTVSFLDDGTGVELLWSGANGKRIYVYLDGRRLGRTLNDGRWLDRLRPEGSVYRICELDGVTCSADVSL